MVPSLQDLCLKTLATELLQGRDVQLGHLPETLALELLRHIAGKDETQLTQALSIWTRQRPPWQLQVSGPFPCSSWSCLVPASHALREVYLSNLLELTDSQLTLLLQNSWSRSLQILNLHECPLLTGHFLVNLLNMSSPLSQPSLQQLLCNQCRGFLDDVVCCALPGLHLTHLSLAGSIHLSDAILSCLSGGAAPAPVPLTMTDLRHLDLSQTKVTDQGASTLIRLPSLTVLMLSRTSVTTTCLRTLSKTLKLHALMPDRPKVLVQNFREAQEAARPKQLSFSEIPAAVDGTILSSLDQVNTWPEDAVRHSLAILFLHLSMRRSRKRPHLEVERSKCGGFKPSQAEIYENTWLMSTDHPKIL